MAVLLLLVLAWTAEQAHNVRPSTYSGAGPCPYPAPMLPRAAYDADGRGHEQASRGRAYRDVIQMYAALVRKHHLDHTSRDEWYEADPYVNQAEAG